MALDVEGEVGLLTAQLSDLGRRSGQLGGLLFQSFVDIALETYHGRDDAHDEDCCNDAHEAVEALGAVLNGLVDIGADAAA